MNKCLTFALAVAGVLLLLTGCGERGASGSVDLESVPAKLIQLKDVYVEHGVQAKSAYSDETTVYLEVRKLKDHRSALTDQEVDRLKKAVFQAVGRTFPLEIQSFTIAEQPEMRGQITAMDGNRVLIVNPDKLIGTEIMEPDAAWYSIGTDADIVNNETGDVIVPEDLRIGYKVNAWSDGMMLSSYPGQTSALRLEVTGTDPGDGDAQGTIEEISIDEEDVWQSYIVVNGEKYRLMPFTLYWAGDRPASIQEIEAGKRVQVWFVGYNAGSEERMASQVKVVSSL